MLPILDIGLNVFKMVASLFGADGELTGESVPLSDPGAVRSIVKLSPPYYPTPNFSQSISTR